MVDKLSKRNLVKHGMERGAYDGANKRRFVLFTRHDASAGNVMRREFDTKRERDAAAMRMLEKVADATYIPQDCDTSETLQTSVRSIISKPADVWETVGKGPGPDLPVEPEPPQWDYEK